MRPPNFSGLLCGLALAVVGQAYGQGTLQTLFETGPRDARLNIVVLSEGYTSSQLASNFRRDASGLIEAFLAREPYATYRNYFNAYAIAVASNEAGADYPASGIVKDTYFNATFGTNGLERLLTISSTGSSRAYALLNSLVPEYDIPLVLVNDSHYGGSGGAIAVASVEQSASEVVIHEIGHSFAGLGDEYDYAGSTPRESPNTTQTTDRALIRWRHWIDPATPIPTPETAQYDPVVGLFEGAAYSTTGWYRPTLDSLMRSLGAENRDVNEEAITLSMLRLLPQIQSAAPTGASLNSQDGQPIHFVVDALQPAGAAGRAVSWFVDGVPVVGDFLRTALINRGAAWRYLASASAAPANWNAAAFSDAAWPSGAAPLGFGDGNEATVIPGGPSSSRYATTYFRKAFTVTDPLTYSALRLELRRDDGAVVYLNGVEIYRSNMPSGAVSYTTLAAPGEGDASENYWFDAVIPTTGLVAGSNLLAVEVHQNSLTSSDLKFDLALSTEVTAYPPEVLIPAGSSWKYRDTGVFPGGSWTSRTFDDSLWSAGLAELGYGDGDEATLVGFGGIPANRYITTWFRKSFAVPDPAEFTGLEINLRRDDGAVVYLNGSELLRSNMNPGTVSPTTTALPADDDGEAWQFHQKTSQGLVSGMNVLAVEVHQNSVSSTDLSFDLSLTGRREPQFTPWIPVGAVWRFWDRGPTDVDWASRDFDDSSWSSGPAELGYGDGGEATTLGYGGNMANRYPASYFRHAFNVQNVDPAQRLKLRLKFDDGALVYLNGVEVVRANLGWGAISYQNLAGREAPTDGASFSVFEFSAASLVPGRNVLAVEVHQAAVDSSDLSFDLELSPISRDSFSVLPSALGAGMHIVEARYLDPSGKIRQDPSDYAIDQRRWTVNVTAPVDSDSDGLPDAWEMAEFGALTRTAGEDSDGDGNTNAAELAAGTKPAQNTSAFAISSMSQLADGRLRLTWDSIPGRHYTVESASSLDSAQWTGLYKLFAAPAPAKFTQADLPAPTPGQREFFRVRISQP